MDTPEKNVSLFMAQNMLYTQKNILKQEFCLNYWMKILKCLGFILVSLPLNLPNNEQQESFSIESST